MQKNFFLTVFLAFFQMSAMEQSTVDCPPIKYKGQTIGYYALDAAASDTRKNILTYIIYDTDHAPRAGFQLSDQGTQLCAIDARMCNQLHEKINTISTHFTAHECGLFEKDLQENEVLLPACKLLAPDHGRKKPTRRCIIQ